MKNKFFIHLSYLIPILLYISNVFPSILKGYTAFTYDNGRDMLEAYKIFWEKKLTLIGPTTGIPGVFHGAWAFYWLIIPMFLFRGHPIGVALCIGIINLAGLCILYYLFKKIFGYFIASLLCLIYAVSPNIISSSIQIGQNNLVPIFVIISLLSIYKIFTNDEKKWLFLFGLSSAFAFEFEFAFGIFILPFNVMFIACYCFFVKKIKTKEFFQKMTLIFSGILLPLAPRLIFELRHSFFMTKNLINNFINPQIRYSQFQNLTFFQRFLNRIEVFFDFWKQLLPKNLEVLTIILLIALFFSLPIIIKITFFREKKEKSLLIYLLSIIFFLFCGFLFYKDVIWGNYLSGFVIFYIFLLGFLFKYIYSIKKKIIIYFFILLTVISLFTTFKDIVNFSEDQMKDQSAIVNQRKAIDYIYSNQSKNANFSVGVYSPSWYSYPYDYWFLWGEKFQGITPPKSLWQTKINYLIIEKGKGDGTEKEWFEKFMNKKAVKVKTKKFGDLKVETWQL